MTGCIEELSGHPMARQQCHPAKPASAKTPLPAILGFHDHGGNKYFGTRKITRTSDDQHPLMVQHQDYYEVVPGPMRLQKVMSCWFRMLFLCIPASFAKGCSEIHQPGIE